MRNRLELLVDIHLPALLVGGDLDSHDEHAKKKRRRAMCLVLEPNVALPAALDSPVSSLMMGMHREERLKSTRFVTIVNSWSFLSADDCVVSEWLLDPYLTCLPPRPLPEVK